MAVAQTRNSPAGPTLDIPVRHFPVPTAAAHIAHPNANILATG